MYSTFQLTIKYLHYYLTASGGKGHGIHSPFVFGFIKHVLNDTNDYPCYQPIERRRKTLLSDETVIEVEDPGAGSVTIKTKNRAVKDIASSSLKPKKYAQLLFRIAKYYEPVTILELGTSFGITSAYLASSHAGANLFTCEGVKSISAVAKKNFDELGLRNIHITEGDFGKTLPSLLQQLGTIDLAFIDGHHKKGPTLDYFTKLLNSSVSSTILIFDDIHWSREMEEAWVEIKQHPSVTLTIDLFFIGLIFINPGFKIPQHFTIRF